MSLRFFKLLEDMTSGSALAQRCDRNGDVADPAPASVYVHADIWGRPLGATAGYWGLWYQDHGLWRFLNSTCVDNSCDVGDSYIDVGTPPEASVNEPYTHTITWDDLVDPPTVTGLPDTLFFDSGTGEITGTPIEPGEYTVIASGVSAENDCPITVAFILVVGPCDVADSYIDADDPPSGTVDTAYTHTILFDDLDGEPEAFGLPPGLSFNGSTGVISGTAPSDPGTWIVTIRGVTLDNGCTIEVEFPLTIGTCDPEDSRIFNRYSNSTYNLYPAELGHPYWASIGYFGVELPLTLYTGGAGYDFPDGLVFDGDTAGITGTPTECGEFTFEIHATTVANECFLARQFTLVVLCPCPDPWDYLSLEAWIVDSAGAESSQLIFQGIGLSSTLLTDNATFRTAEPIITNLPPGLSWNPVSGEITGAPTSLGEYATIFYGTVTSGPHAGCQIIHTRTYTVIEAPP